MSFLDELAARQRFGMRPGLETIRAVLAALGNPQWRVPCIHLAGTNGKGATAAILDSCLRAAGLHVGRYTSPHLVRLNERFFLDGQPLADELLEAAAARVRALTLPEATQLTFFEALTTIAFLVYAEAQTAVTVFETGLGGRLDATNVCHSELSVLTRIGLDHCAWLGESLEAITAEKAGIIRPGVPVVLGCNVEKVQTLVAARAQEVGAPFYYAPDLVQAHEVVGLSLQGAFNRENAITALAALKVLKRPFDLKGLSQVIWPGRFQRVGVFLVDGAHNPPAATALVAALQETEVKASLALVAGFCADKDVATTLRLLAPYVVRGFAVKTTNPRSLSAQACALKMQEAGFPACACTSLATALAAAREAVTRGEVARVLVCGSLFLAGEALVALGAYPWPADRVDPAECLRAEVKHGIGG